MKTIFFNKKKQWKTEGGIPYQMFYKSAFDDFTHLLIGGTTGSGKSVLLNGLISTAILTESPAELKLILIDPKGCELNQYQAIPHCIGYARTPAKALEELKKAVALMESRNEKLYHCGGKKSKDYRVVIVIDELASLLISADAKGIKRELQELTQKARSANISVICATQSPSRKTIPPEITLNFTDFIALRCRSAIESRQIIGVNGAELLPKYGKGLYYSPDIGRVQTVDIPMTSDYYIRQRCEWWERQK